MSDNRANRIAKTLRARARRKKAKKYARPKREDFRQSLLEAIHEAAMQRHLAELSDK